MPTASPSVGLLLTLATARLSRKTLLIGLTVAFTIGQAACRSATFGAARRK